jgi:hypothetical protein
LLELAARGYAWRRRARVDLVLVLTARTGYVRGTLRLRDPGAHLMLTSLRFDRLRLICHGLRVDGLGQTGQRRMRFFVIAEAGRRTMTLGIVVPGLGYRLSGSVPGHLTLRMPR